MSHLKGSELRAVSYVLLILLADISEWQTLAQVEM